MKLKIEAMISQIKIKALKIPVSAAMSRYKLCE
jgi:hypothetical protein